MARSFNGTTAKVDAGTSSTLNPAAQSFSAWINITSYPAAYAGIVSHRDAGGLTNFTFYIKSTGHTAMYLISASSAPQYDPGTAALSLATWYHVAGTYSNAAGGAGYVNGVVDGTLTGGTGIIVSQSANFVWGADIITAGRFFNGLIDDGATWNIALTANDIKALANGARPSQIRPSSLIGYWPLYGLQSPEPDFSGNALNGTVTAATLAAGAPIMMSTPRQPQFLAPAAAASTAVFRRSLSAIGTRTGSRQRQGLDA